MKFSTRTAWQRADTRYLGAAVRAQAAGKQRSDVSSLIDLTAANPATCGLAIDAEHVLTPLGGCANLTYDPRPFGLLRAREAVADYYAARSAAVSPDAIVLTASTSEAYSYLLRLLCNVGDEVLIASPGYPLLDVLADLCDVKLIHYPLFYDHGWHIDRAALEAAITSQTRAIVVIHPNNPTGHYTGDVEREFLEAICARHDLALIVDEVFLDYAVAPRTIDDGVAAQSFTCDDHPVLTFVLSGLSKIAALPQMKVAWMAVEGPGRREALERLEIIADSYLSVGAPAQNALPEWLRASAGVQGVIRSRVNANLAMLDELIAAQTLVTRLKVEAGWYAILRLPDIAHDKEVAVRLLETQRVLAQPGHLFGMHGDCRLIVSLLTETTVFKEGVRRILEFATRLPGSSQS
jgi:aspartate/methionine/tyrosine aminotransferase